MGRQSLHQCPRSPFQARITQIKLLEFRRRPACRSVCQLRHANDESKRDFLFVYKGLANSLNGNGNSGRQRLTAGHVYNEVNLTWPTVGRFNLEKRG
jgi:hypothetical protein